MKIKVLYEDSNILAIEKPSGILVHPAPSRHGGRYGASPDKSKTIKDIFLEKYPKLEIVHRLDRETSGVLLLAKNQKAHEFLKKQFSAPALGLKTKSGLADKVDRIKKTYIAIVDGFVKNDHGVINKPIGRSPSDFRRRLSGRGARGEMREAITEYKVIKRFINNKNKFSYLEVKPKTGRTHQIRVHMKFLNHPVAGDTLYNPAPPPNLLLVKGEGKFKRMMLHAKSIEFKNLKGETIKVESPIPTEFKKACPALNS